MPLKTAPPSLQTVAAVPILVSPPVTFIPPASIPVLCTLVVPVLKLVAVAIPLETKLGKVIPGLIPESVT